MEMDIDMSMSPLTLIHDCLASLLRLLPQLTDTDTNTKRETRLLTYYNNVRPIQK